MEENNRDVFFELYTTWNRGDQFLLRENHSSHQIIRKEIMLGSKLEEITHLKDKYFLNVFVSLRVEVVKTWF